jgi:GNAT superfamily N-acetyltransferase
MAAVRSSLHDVTVRAATRGEGSQIASLWRELWDAHEAWDGYKGSTDPRVYEQLAARLDEDARIRGGHPALGRHIHLVAARDRDLIGQVEGWFDRHGLDETTPYTCEVRSLIVRAEARGTGAGRALLDTLAVTAQSLSRGAPVFLAAEVLEPNPAHTFYARVGYVPISYSARIMSSYRGPSLADGMTARVAEPRDALAVALLDAKLAGRRRSAGDLRFDRPRAVDATLVGAIAAHLTRRPGLMSDPTELVAVDASGEVRASASLALAPLEPPFLPAKRAIVGRFALDPMADPLSPIAAIVALGARLAAVRGAATVELTDLTAPNTPLHNAILATGAREWSRVVAKYLRAVPQ